jgi:hypothetical protein
MSLAEMQVNLGFVPPWAIGVAKDVLAPWAIDQALNWLERRLKEQDKINQELVCHLGDLLKLASEIRQGQYKAPEKEGQWYEYDPQPTAYVTDLSAAFSKLSEQIEALHKDTVKAINPLESTRELPQLIECFTDPDTGAIEAKEIEYDRMITDYGFVRPWGEDKYAAQSHWVTGRAMTWNEQLLQEQNKLDTDIFCDLTGPFVLLPDPRAVWNTFGNYLLFYWKLEDPQTPEEKRWNNRTQLAEPIDALLAGGEEIWEVYFAPIKIVLGNQWGSIYSADKARRNPLYRGWFKDIPHAEEKLWQIANLSKIPKRDNDNPSFPIVRNQTTRLQFQGKTMILRKVCVGYKSPGSDRVDILFAYEPPPPETP